MVYNGGFGNLSDIVCGHAFGFSDGAAPCFGAGLALGELV